MNKKTIISVIIFLVIILGVCVLTNSIFNEQIKVGELNFDLPNGYHANNTNKIGDLAITNGTHAVYIAEYNNTNISNFINSYINEINKTNETVTITNFTIDEITVYKSTLSNNGANHYWFSYNNKIYSIYNWNDNPKMDTIVFDLIKSMKIINK